MIAKDAVRDEIQAAVNSLNHALDIYQPSAFAEDSEVPRDVVDEVKFALVEAGNALANANTFIKVVRRVTHKLQKSELPSNKG